MQSYNKIPWYNGYMSQVFAAIVTEEDAAFVASNPDTGVASQGDTLNEALANLKEALELYIEELGNDTKKSLPNLSHSFLTTITI
jgi:predicted RNase H-like HicB family nuclease